MNEKRVDEDWKRRAQVEKELDAAKSGGVEPAAPRKAGPRDAAAGFSPLVDSLATQALMLMGAIRDPNTGQTYQEFPQAQATIDILDMLEEKTKGNLTKEETVHFAQVLDEVRLAFVRLTAPPPKAPMMGNRPPHP